MHIKECPKIIRNIISLVKIVKKSRIRMCTSALYSTNNSDGVVAINYKFAKWELFNIAVVRICKIYKQLLRW